LDLEQQRMQLAMMITLSQQKAQAEAFSRAQ